MNVMLVPNNRQSVTRPECYGTPSYFGTVEWFDVVDRYTNELLPWTVSRIDGREVTVNHPSQGVDAGLASIRTAAELIHARRM
jgi:hypothetical protein